MLYGILWQALDVLESSESLEAKIKAAGFCGQAMDVISESDCIFTAWLEYNQALVKAGLGGAMAVDREEVFKDTFQEFTRDLERRFGDLTDRGLAIQWALLRQDIFIQLNIDGKKRGERIPNPTFKAATFYRNILMRHSLENLMGWRLMSEKTKPNTAALLKGIQKHPRRTHP